MDTLLYLLLGLGGIGMVYLMHRFPQLAGAAFLIATAVGGTVLLLSQ